MLQELKNIESERLLVFGGVYGNLEALLALRARATDLGILPNSIFCTGDTVAYCGNPNECIEVVRDWGIHSISGNVEEQLAVGGDHCGCNFEAGSVCDALSARWYNFIDSTLLDSHREWMAKLPKHIHFSFHNRDFLVVHGTPVETSGYVFKSTPWSVKAKYFESNRVDVILSGHSGLPFVDKKNKLNWVNSGALGMPANDGTRRTWFAIVEKIGAEISFSLQHLDFDSEKTVAAMKENNLPEEYSKTLFNGLWSNEDVLPEAERLLRGQALASD